MHLWKLTNNSFIERSFTKLIPLLKGLRHDSSKTFQLVMLRIINMVIYKVNHWVTNKIQFDSLCYVNKAQSFVIACYVLCWNSFSLNVAFLLILKQATDKQLDQTGLSTFSIEVFFRKVFWSIPQPCQQMQISTVSHAKWLFFYTYSSTIINRLFIYGFFFSITKKNTRWVIFCKKTTTTKKTKKP